MKMVTSEPKPVGTMSDTTKKTTECLSKAEWRKVHIEW